MTSLAPTALAAPVAPTRRERLVALACRLARSGGAGLIATVADVTTLKLLVNGAGVDPRIANGPALLAGAVTMFFGQRYFGFRAHIGVGANRGVARRQAIAFAVTQVITLSLNYALFDLGLRLSPLTRAHVVVLRLVASNIVWLGFSFPVWHWVFRLPAGAAAAASAPE